MVDFQILRLPDNVGEGWHASGNNEEMATREGNRAVEVSSQQGKNLA